MRVPLATLLLVLTSTVTLVAQQLYFPQVNLKDRSTLSNTIPALARQVIQHYKAAEKSEYWDNLFRYQIVAHEYLQARATLDSMRQLYAAESSAAAQGIAYEAYMLTKVRQQSSNRTFADIFNEVLGGLYNKLPEPARPMVINYFDIDLQDYEARLDTLIGNLNALHKDSISLTDARRLCRVFNSVNVFTQVGRSGLDFLANVERSQYIILDSVLIPTKEAQLSAIIVRSRKRRSPQPVVMMYDIYADKLNKIAAMQAADQGYAGIVVHTRGKYLSPQNVEPFEHDAADAYDVMEWISNQPWCNGKIGMYGGSYLGFAQWSAVKKLHPALKTIVPQVAVGIGIDYPMHNNVFMSYMLRWIHHVTNNKTTDEEFYNTAKWEDLYRRWYVSGKSFRALDSLEGRPKNIFQRWLDHPSYDGYWHAMVPYQSEFSKINIPILTVTGYFDDDQRGALFYFNEHNRFNKKANHYMVIGPYDHGAAQSFAKLHFRGYTIDSAANISVDALVFQWFDYILKNGKKPTLLKDKVNYQVMGANQWKHASSLQSMNKDTINFYLSTVRTKSHYKLSPTAIETKSFIEQEVDFKDRSDVNKINMAFEYPIVDSVLTADESLSFISAPMEDFIELNGSFCGELKFIINKKDIDLLVELYEWQPDGKYFALSSFLTRASFTKNKSDRQLLQPGKEKTIPINNSYFVSRRINKGSRIIVRVGAHKKPNWQINYGSGKDVSDETIKDAAVPLLFKLSNESFISLPISK